MPTYLGETVASTALQTSPNARPQHLSNKWIVTAGYNTTEKTIYLQVNKMDGNGFVPLANIMNVTYYNGKFSMVSKGNFVYLAACAVLSGQAAINFWSIDVTKVPNVQLTSSTTGVFYTNITNVSTAQIDFDSVSLNIIDSAIYAGMSRKSTDRSNCFNAAYNKGVINPDGSVTWGTLGEVTIQNSSGGYDTRNVSTIVANGRLLIFADIVFVGNGNRAIVCFNQVSGNIHNGAGSGSIMASGWYWNLVHNGVSFAQSQPQAIFSDKSMNGLANGRIHAVWQGNDAAYPSSYRSRYSYSDDLGATWSPMILVSDLSVSNYGRPTITANKNGDIFVISDFIDIATIGVRRMAKGETTFSAWATYSNTGNYPSALYDPSLNFTEPLFIYQGTSKVGFKGTWIVTDISVPQGSIGQVTDKNNLLSYSITTDGTMTAITEKVNDVTVGTKTAASGESLTVGLTQEQWDAIRFGKYADASGNQNTLTIEMGSEKWTYTFDKRPATDADIISAAKVIKDYAETVDPSRRALMAAMIRSKGGSALDSADWETLAQSVGGITLGRKYASGSVTSGGTYSFMLNTGGYSSYNHVAIDMSLLGFIPSMIKVYTTNKSNIYLTNWYKDDFYYISESNKANAVYSNVAFRCPYTTGLLYLPVQYANTPFSWEAVE